LSPRDAVGIIVATAALIAILVNMLFLQPGPHRAPILKTGIVAAVPATGPELASTTSGQPQPRVIELAPPKSNAGKAGPAPSAPAHAAPAPAHAARPAAEVVADIQRELARRGYYDGVVDGRYGPRTDAAIRDFEQAVGLRPSGQPNEELLRTIQRSPAKVRPVPPASVPRKQASPPTRQDPIGDMLSPSNRVMAVQRALSEFGYGQINPSGVIDPDTQQAIERFERERRLPVTGQLSHRVVRELASVTGRPLE
jgi:peptidoglycan hydrolase-like protein with peptidoglycan-binding domain